MTILVACKLSNGDFSVSIVKSLWLDFDYAFEPYIQQVYENILYVGYIVDDPAGLLAAIAQQHADSLGDWITEINIIEAALK